MNEKEIKELILTVYLDAESSPDELKRIEEVLEKYPQYQEFADEARRTVMNPFEGSSRREPSPEIWERIKSKITPEPAPQYRVTFQDSIWAKFGRVVFSAKAIVVVICLLFASAVLSRYNQYTKLQQEASETYVEYVLEEMNFEAEDNALAYAETIEEYFL